MSSHRPFELDDLLIVQRDIPGEGPKTHKAEFRDLQESLDITHDFNATVLETKGGTIENFSITNKGSKFIVGQTYFGVNNVGSQLEFLVEEIEAGGLLKTIRILRNGAIEDDSGKSFTANPIKNDGSLENVVFSGSARPNLSPGSSNTYRVRQTNTTDGNDIVNSGIVEVTNVNGTDYTIRIVDRGDDYSNTGGAFAHFLQYTQADGTEVNGAGLSVKIINVNQTSGVNGSYDKAVINADTVSDGADDDKAELTVTLSGIEKKIHLVPGTGIVFNDLGQENGIDQLEIVSTIQESEIGEIIEFDGATVIVDENAPDEFAYNIKDGTLWYNLRDGRLYVAVTYFTVDPVPDSDGNPIGGVKSFDWIDASPSAYNDSLRKNQDDKTYFNIDIEMDSTLNPGGGNLYAYHYDLERLPLIS